MPGSLPPPPPPSPSSSSRPHAANVSAAIASSNASHTVLFIALLLLDPSCLARRHTTHRRLEGLLAWAPASQHQLAQAARKPRRALREHPHECDQHPSVDHAGEC